MTEQQKIDKIAEKVMGWGDWRENPSGADWKDWRWFDNHGKGDMQNSKFDWNPFTNWNDAWMVLEKMMQDYKIEFVIQSNHSSIHVYSEWEGTYDKSGCHHKHICDLFSSDIKELIAEAALRAVE